MKIIEKIVAGILIVIAVGMAIHTPLTLWLGTLVPDWALVIKAWKEVLMGIALVLLVIIAARQKKLNALLADRVLQLCLVFAGLHFVMVMVFQNGLQEAGAGLLIDLRFVLYFVLAYVFLTLFPGYRQTFLKAFAAGAAIIIGFAMLQMTVLPKDILASIGYGDDTIQPYLTVDENPEYVRINSTLRGPNPLGAYVVIIVGLLTALDGKWRLSRRGLAIGALAALVAGLTLGATYSRSSVIAAIVTILVIILVSSTAKVRKRLGIAIVAVGIVFSGLLYVLRDTPLVANVIFHNSPTTGAAVDSNSGHADSLADGTNRMLRQPLGAGVGSTGSASLNGEKPLIIENQYLLVAHEVGWLGLGLFAWLYVEVMRRLWHRRASALALGVFGAGIGLAVIGLLLPVWTDDTVSIVWWGLAAAAIAAPVAQAKVKKAKKTKGKKRHGT